MQRAMLVRGSSALVVLAVPLILVLCAWTREAPGRGGPDHDERQIQGFRVLVSKALLAREAALAKQALRELENQLYLVSRAVPGPALEKLREVPIWLSHESKTTCAAYHPSREFLATHAGYDERMAKAVEIGSAANFVAWTRIQPYMVLHELAHAYHDRVLGFDHEGIRAAFARATADPRWREVLHADGARRAHYALTDEKEWFAEASEALLGTNDFFPFVRAELRELDPQGEELCARLWGLPGR
jgi:hypothetical protein